MSTNSTTRYSIGEGSCGVYLSVEVAERLHAVRKADDFRRADEREVEGVEEENEPFA